MTRSHPMYYESEINNLENLPTLIPSTLSYHLDILETCIEVP